MVSDVERLVGQLKALGDPVRLRLTALCAQGECSVSELTRITGLSQPRVSQHLRQLCDAGLLERFRDGHFVYYRVRSGGDDAVRRRGLLSLLPEAETFERDYERLLALRRPDDAAPAATEDDRPLHRALLELSVAAPFGDLIDIGSGRGRLLKLLASRTRRAVGVDTDAGARQLARAEVLLAGLPNCTLRNGNMYALPFDDAEFDTVILDDVLADAGYPADALAESVRLLRPAGRLLILSAVSADDDDSAALTTRLAGWCRDAGLRLAPPRAVPSRSPRWLLAVATRAEVAGVAA